MKKFKSGDHLVIELNASFHTAFVKDIFTTSNSTIILKTVEFTVLNFHTATPILMDYKEFKKIIVRYNIEFTCHNCNCAPTCPSAYNVYNTDQACLAEKIKEKKQ